jgi:1,4-dihydroxy-2-naphthoyl-CoA hydrolase
MAGLKGRYRVNIEQAQRTLPALPQFLGMTFTRVEPDGVAAEIVVRAEHCTTVDTIHGGAIMLLADTMGAVGTAANLREGQSTTTLESKTNFFAPAPTGTKLVAETLPLHRGRRTHVWETTIRNTAGRLVAKVTQTQMVL